MHCYNTVPRRHPCTALQTPPPGKRPPQKTGGEALGLLSWKKLKFRKICLVHETKEHRPTTDLRKKTTMRDEKRLYTLARIILTQHHYTDELIFRKMRFIVTLFPSLFLIGTIQTAFTWFFVISVFSTVFNQQFSINEPNNEPTDSCCLREILKNVLKMLCIPFALTLQGLES